jgi:hypothetical protein
LYFPDEKFASARLCFFDARFEFLKIGVTA